MWYLILLFSLVGCANRYSEECSLYSRAQGTGDVYGTTWALARKSLGTTDLEYGYKCMIIGYYNTLNHYELVNTTQLHMTLMNGLKFVKPYFNYSSKVRVKTILHTWN
jgi:hypothetical protein